MGLKNHVMRRPSMVPPIICVNVLTATLPLKVLLVVFVIPLKPKMAPPFCTTIDSTVS